MNDKQSEREQIRYIIKRAVIFGSDIARKLPHIKLLESPNDQVIDALCKEVDTRLEAAVRKAFIAGFKVSGEGWNGEYPYADKNIDPTNDLQEHIEKYLQKQNIK